MNLKNLKYFIGKPDKILVKLADMKTLCWMSDKKYLSKIYKYRYNKKIDWDNPVTLSEKMQWLKINNRNPLYTKLVDKYEVRKYVADTIGEEYLIPLLGVWDKFDDIDFDLLPDEFVIKCTHNSGGIAICRDKSRFDIEKAKNKINKCLKSNFFWQGREWPYKNVKPKIIAEKYMDDFNRDSENYGSGLTDYKFFTFNGKTEFLYISHGLENHATAQISFFDLNGKMLPFKRSDYKGFDGNPVLPKNIKKMIELSDLCAQKIKSPFLRVDFYEINDKIYFSEFTFYPCGGMIPLEPKEWDKKLGDMLNLK